MVKSSTTSITPAQHADNHRTGGTDPLTGAVGIDNINPPIAHVSRHDAGGADTTIRDVSASTTLQYSNDSLKTTTSLTAVKVKGIRLNYDISGEIRIEAKIYDPGNKATHFRIYRNGSPVGVQQNHTGAGTWSAAKIQDISGWFPNDEMDLYAWLDNAGTLQVKEFRLSYNRNGTMNNDP